MNTAKRSNLLFLIIITSSLAASVFTASLRYNGVPIAIIPNILISQLIIFLPGMTFYLIYNEHGSFRVFRKIKISSAILFVIFAELILPLATAVNVFSQLFTKNEVAEMSTQITELPFFVTFLIVGILGPLNEEFIFRGVIFKGLLKGSMRPLLSAVISALFFGLMHLNLNQAMYAFVLGLIFAIIDYSLDSLLPSVICHCVVNSQNVVLMYVMQKMLRLVNSDMMNEMDAFYSQKESKLVILVMFIIFFAIAMFATTLSVLLLYAICSIEKKTDRLKSVIKKPVSKARVLYITGVISIIVCLFIIFLLEPVRRILEKL